MKKLVVLIPCLLIGMAAQAKDVGAKTPKSAQRTIASEFTTPEMAAVALVKSMFGRPGDTVVARPRSSDRPGVIPVNVRGTNGGTLVFEVNFKEFQTDARVGQTVVNLSVKLVDAD